MSLKRAELLGCAKMANNTDGSVVFHIDSTRIFYEQHVGLAQVRNESAMAAICRYPWVVKVNWIPFRRSLGVGGGVARSVTITTNSPPCNRCRSMLSECSSFQICCMSPSSPHLMGSARGARYPELLHCFPTADLTETCFVLLRKTC